MTKLKIWQPNRSWEEAENAWEEGARKAASERPIKGLKTLPNMPGITQDTRKNLRWKAFWYMLRYDHNGKVRKGFLKHPLKYASGFFRSLFKKKAYTRDEDFFLYGVPDVETFEKCLDDPDTLLVLGFSYCHKPFECPSGRFTDDCMHDPENPVCRQCFIGKAVHAMPENNVIPLFIPTIHYIGSKIFDIVHANPNKKVIFIITACELTLEMFADWGNMVDIKGVGVRLDGRICNTMKAFELSERGVKPGLTVVTDKTQERVLQLLKRRRERS